LRDISRTNRAEFEDAEREFQQYEDFPGIKPKPLKPEKVLEPLPTPEPDALEVLTG